MLNRRLVIALSTAALLGACATAQHGPAPVDVTIARNPDLSTLNGLLQKAGMAESLKGAGPYTVFAPTNEAFKAVPAKTMDELGKDPAKLKSLLSYHVLPARLASSEVKNGNAKTLQGADLALSRAGTFVTVEDAVVQAADIVATNGVIHTVDRVLMPPVRR